MSRFVEEGNTRQQRSLYLYTGVVLCVFSFFWKTCASARKIFFPYPYPAITPLRWRSINPPRVKFYHAPSSDFEEKIEGLWTGY